MLVAEFCPEVVRRRTRAGNPWVLVATLAIERRRSTAPRISRTCVPSEDVTRAIHRKQHILKKVHHINTWSRITFRRILVEDVNWIIGGGIIERRIFASSKHVNTKLCEGILMTLLISLPSKPTFTASDNVVIPILPVAQSNEGERKTFFRSAGLRQVNYLNLKCFNGESCYCGINYTTRREWISSW